LSAASNGEHKNHERIELDNDRTTGDLSAQAQVSTSSQEPQFSCGQQSQLPPAVECHRTGFLFHPIVISIRTRTNILLLSGRIGIVFFDDSGGVVSDAVLDPGVGLVWRNDSGGTFHSLVSLAPGSAFSKRAGPYWPLSEMRSWRRLKRFRLPQPI
jgi:hypothetical protein